jgi:uncharacterized membrane protein YesL
MKKLRLNYLGTPELMPFLRFSLFALGVMAIMKLVFTKMDEKQIVLEQGNYSKK